MDPTFTDFSVQLTDYLVPWISILISIIVAMWFKDFAVNLVSGMRFYLTSSFNQGDRVYVDGIEARIISTGARMTIFEVSHDDELTWRYVPNHRMDFIKLEKILEK